MTDVQLILYDVKSQLSGTFSPFVWRIRSLLKYKGLKFRTEWLEYPEIEGKAKSFGIPPTSKMGDKPWYTLPMIKDLQNGGKVLADSLFIAEYLDEAYPDTPRVIPEGMRPLFAAWADAIDNNIGFPSFRFVCYRNWEILNPESQPYVRNTREGFLCKKLEELAPPGDRREEEWKKEVVGSMEKMARWYKNPDDIYLVGKISFADFQLFGNLIYLRKFVGEESQEWKSICELEGGRWKRLVEDISKYES